MCILRHSKKFADHIEVKKIEDVVREAEVMAEQGIKELTIIAQDTLITAKTFMAKLCCQNS